MNTGYYKLIFFILSFIFIVSCKSINSDLNMMRGNFIDESNYPTIVKVLKKDKTFVCSGVIVSENVVLTAAHCILSMTKKSNRYQSAVPEERGVIVNKRFIKSSAVVLLDGYIHEFFKYQSIYTEKSKIDKAYINGEKSRSQYESSVAGLMNILPRSTEDLGAIIFENNDKGIAPFKSIIEEAKKKGSFFILSKDSYLDDTVLEDDKESVFFLGYGTNSSYDSLKNITRQNSQASGLQIGYNTIRYSKSKNNWSTLRPQRGAKISDDILQKSNTFWGDSGGPLIYKNKILGVSSRGDYYDCEGNGTLEPSSDEFLGIDSKTGKKKNTQYTLRLCYCNSYFASVVLDSDSKVAESFIGEVNKKLSAFDLFKDGNNSIFKELLE